MEDHMMQHNVMVITYLKKYNPKAFSPVLSFSSPSFPASSPAAPLWLT
jgi:hypothetical protein